jgi:methylenetetrahydrofolate dehydrogenase (NADP+)/methenyltetrahydrofolate cyclohydrolase
MTTLINGNQLAKKLRENVKNEVQTIVNNGGRAPHLVAILVGDDGASTTYVNSKENDCKNVGFESSVHRLPTSTSEEELINLIIVINNNPEIDGLIVQLPLPKHINAQKVTETIAPEIDVDGFNTVSVGKLTKGEDTYVSATPLGIMKMLEHYNIPTKGKHCVVIGRSNIVGRPMSILMSGNTNPGNCTVTLCHRETPDSAYFTRMADIVIVAVGIPNFVKKDWIKKDAVVIDVGITRVAADNAKGYTLVGDVDFDEVKDQCSHITPVPGGVGPMTRYALLHNTLLSYKRKYKL